MIQNKTIHLIIFPLLLLGLWYAIKQVDMYHAWVKNDAIEDFESCMIFESPDALCSVLESTEDPYVSKIVGSKKCRASKETYEEAIESCETYARDGDTFSPYPWYKAIILSLP